MIIHNVKEFGLSSKYAATFDVEIPISIPDADAFGVTNAKFTNLKLYRGKNGRFFISWPVYKDESIGKVEWVHYMQLPQDMKRSLDAKILDALHPFVRELQFPIPT